MNCVSVLVPSHVAGFNAGLWAVAKRQGQWRGRQEAAAERWPSAGSGGNGAGCRRSPSESPSMSAEQEVETGRLGALAVLEAGQHETAGRLSCVRGNGWDSAVAL
eukprot:CAMPEP_0185331524 /NCGR_PEP_ID=MMETSP1363-20130426/79423_1 /TAXON_ID=38817 /ORGANISM="Gephyrocapsa oceanica, Strain RCC1303" /LENGTH=104 /DNA_ID=CAMNT_0027930405 /DNA_START=161 /DNA_END=472 /DNA_ORIENTATION=+